MTLKMVLGGGYRRGYIAEAVYDVYIGKLQRKKSRLPRLGNVKRLNLNDERAQGGKIYHQPDLILAVAMLRYTATTPQARQLSIVP